MENVITSNWSYSGAGSDKQLRLMTKIARMYHEQGYRQAQIADELQVSQPRVSRLLKRAAEVGIVRTTVSVPTGVYIDVEDALQEKYALTEAVVVDASGLEDVMPALGAAAATYLETTLIGGETIGISSWSETLLATVDNLHSFKSPVADRVIQLLGGLGNPAVQVNATRLTSQLAALTGGTAVFLPSPAVVGGNAAREAMLSDSATSEITDQWKGLTMALVGIGGVEPSPLLRKSGNAITSDDIAQLHELGAVGDVCLNFFDENGVEVDSHLSARVISIPGEALRAVPRRVAVAGGARKLAAIRGALRGHWITVLITDLDTANGLLESEA